MQAAFDLNFSVGVLRVQNGLWKVESTEQLSSSLKFLGSMYNANGNITPAKYSSKENCERQIDVDVGCKMNDQRVTSKSNAKVVDCRLDPQTKVYISL